jgi:hypothetical protein
VTHELGRIVRIDPRTVWKHEAHDFTRWMVANLDALGEALGLEIEADAEIPVGTFSVDLAGRDVASGRPLIIENQLAPTDHSHLGQLMTYAAGTQAAIVVWVSPRFRDEHRRALDWLNEHTDENVDFFGVEIELVRIGDSLPAPNFKMVAQPNEWAKGTRHAAGPSGSPTDRALAYRAFFEKALTKLKELQPGITTASRVGTQNWFSFSAGRSYVQFSWTFATGARLRTELYVDATTQEESKAIFDALHARAAEVEASVGSSLSWERLDDKRASRIAVYHHVPEGPFEDDPELLQWAVDTMLRFTAVFRPLIKGI